MTTITEMADWRDAFPLDSECEVSHEGKKWVRGVVVGRVHSFLEVRLIGRMSHDMGPGTAWLALESETRHV
jgi:hypothetical protein